MARPFMLVSGLAVYFSVISELHSIVWRDHSFFIPRLPKDIFLGVHNLYVSLRPGFDDSEQSCSKHDVQVSECIFKSGGKCPRLQFLGRMARARLAS